MVLLQIPVGYDAKIRILDLDQDLLNFLYFSALAVNMYYYENIYIFTHNKILLACLQQPVS